MINLRKIFFSVFVIIIFSANAFSQEALMPAYKGYVNDFANVITDQDQAALQQLINAIKLKTTAEIAVVTISDISPLTIEQYAVRLFEKWGIGSKEKDNGVLILLAVKQRRVRIETGYGLEGAIPDALASNIINQLMLPEFRNNNLSKGLVAGTAAVAGLIAKEYNVDIDSISKNVLLYPEITAEQEKSESVLNFIFTLIFFMLIFGMRSGLLFLFLFGRNGRRRGGMWYGTGYGGSRGGFGGGFGGFGGGFSGGGGASGGW